MANIRVYELAKDLNMKNRVLLEKLSKMDIVVRSHMSSLDDDTVSKIRANLLGKDAQDETRDKKTVIRRRKKFIHKKPVFSDEQKDKVSSGSGVTEVSSSEPAREKDGVGGNDPINERAPSEKVLPNFIKREREVSSSQRLEPAKYAGGFAEQKDGKQRFSEKNEPMEKKVPNFDTPVKSVSPSASSKERNSGSNLRLESARGSESSGNTSDSKERKDSDYPSQKKSDYQLSSADLKAKKSRKRKRRRKDTPARIIKLPSLEAASSLKPDVGSSRSDVGSSLRLEPTNRRPTISAKAPAAEKTAASETVAHVKDKREFHGKRRPEIRRRPIDGSISRDPSSVRPVPSSEQIPPKDLSETADKYKKKRKKEVGGITEPVSDDKKPKEIRWAKKKISFKRKEVVEGDDLYGGRGKKSRKNSKVKTSPVQNQKPQITTPKAIKRRIKIDDTIVLSDLAKRMGIKAAEMIAKLMGLGVMVTVNQTIDFDIAAAVAAEFNYEVEKASFEENSFLKMTEKDEPENMTWRAPVVTIMGHVDHGKTSLLDVIRKTRVTENEAGGITQHIGAYNVSTERGQITFLDTPGHEAFTAMRARGALVTDIVVLVVAADDGVMPQTIEAINHSRAAGVPIIVAVNKIDKNNANIDRVYRELSEHGLMSEDWGGETIFVKVSAKQNIGIDTLLEMILLQSEVLELKANHDKPAAGYVVEAKLDSGRGPVATVLIKDGTLRTGDAVVCGIHHGKIRAMLNDRGVQVNEAGPSVPIEILGLSGVPNAGDELVSVSDDKSAKQVSLHRIQKQRSIDLAKTSRISLEKLFEKMQQGEVKDLNLIIKADVHGSIEAIRDSLVKLSNKEVNINIIHSATGTITESDVSLAAVSNAIIIGFNVRPTPKVQSFANEEHVDIRFYNIIYNVIKDIQDAIVGMMKSTYEERILGRADVREVFHVPKIGAIAGCYVTDGKIQRGQLVRLLREGVVIFDGKLASLRRFKDDVKEVISGYECGIGIENYNDIKLGDVVECYYMEEIKPVISEQ